MKPKIDLENPIINLVLELYKRHVTLALESSQIIEKAIIPIYAIPNSKGHQSLKKKAEQFGSGVLLNIREHYFILSCTHLFEAFEGYVLKTGDGKGSLIQDITGERFSTGSIDNPYSNNLDATVFYIQSEISNSLKELAISIEDLEFEDDSINIKPVYLSSGFRVKKSNTAGNQVSSKREAFPSIEFNSDIYNLLNINKEMQILTVYEDNILVNGCWQKSPIPKGFSGGGLIKIEGTNILAPIYSNIKTKQKLRAIIIEHHRENTKKPGFLISTKVGVHIGLIYKYLPELFE